MHNDNNNNNLKKSIKIQSSDDEDQDIENIAMQFHAQINDIEEDNVWYRKLKQKKLHNNVQISQYKHQYLTEISKALKSEKLTLQTINQKYSHRFISHNITFFPTKFSSISILRLDATINSQIAQYRVNISYFQLKITILNLDFPFLFENAVEILGGGSFGNVYLVDVYGKKYAAKNVMFEQTDGDFKGNQRQKVYQTLIQYCIAKICSSMQVGVSMQTALGFDLICYSNCIQFFMQRGQLIHQLTPQTKQQLLYNLSLMHRIQLIHNDIKPANIMYSPTYNRNVFIDYGISEFISQTIGYQTKVNFKGSYNYTLDQMKSLLGRKLAGYVDLYFNDLNALKITIKELDNLFVINNKLGQEELSFSKIYNHELKVYNQKLLQSSQCNNHNLTINNNSQQLSQKIANTNINFIINLILTIYCLLTQKPYNQITLQIIQSNIQTPDTFYLILADIITQLPPSAIIYQYFKKYIQPLLITKSIIDHTLFSIYKEGYFVPWLKENQKKERKFQSRLLIVEEIMNYHLLILSKPATIDRFLKGFKIKMSWSQKISYYICYVDFISRNCIKGKQYLVQRMYKLIYSNKQHQKDNNSIEKNKEKHFYNDSQSSHLNIDYKSYQILCYIYQEFPNNEILNQESLWLASLLLNLFEKFSDYQKAISINNLLLSQSRIKNHKCQCFKYTFDIFAILQRNPSPRYFPEMRKRIQQMHQIRKSIEIDVKSYSSRNLFITSILIKISQFFMQIAVYTHIRQKSQKIKYLEQKISQIEIELKNEGISEQSIQSKVALHKIYQAQFILSYLKLQYHQVIYYGNLIINLNNQSQTIGSNRSMNQNIMNIMAQAYMQLGHLQNSKKCIYRDRIFQVSQNFYSNFTNQWIKFKINIIDNNLEEAKINMNYIKKMCNDQEKQIYLVNNLITFDVKFCDSFRTKQPQRFILTQLQMYFVKINQWPLKIQQNVWTFRIMMILQKWPSLSQKQLVQGLINYRKIVGKVVQERFLTNQFEKLNINRQISDGLNEYFSNVEYPTHFPPLHIQPLLPQLFFTLHLKYYQLYQSPSLIFSFYQLSTRLLPYTHNLISLELYINYYYFTLNNQHINNQEMFNNLSDILHFIFFSKRQFPLMQKRWYRLFFMYDAKFYHQKQQKFTLSLYLIAQITNFIKYSPNPNLFTMLYSIAQYFLALITKITQIDLFLHKMQLQNPKLTEIPEFSIFLLPFYQKILNTSSQSIESYDHILLTVIKSFRSLPLKARTLLKQYLPSFIYQRFNFAIQNAIIKFPNLHKIKVLCSEYSQIQLYQKQKYYRKKNIRNPYSNFDIKSQKLKRKISLFDYQSFKVKSFNNISKNVLNVLQQKFQKHIKNKQTQNSKT